MPPKKDKQVVKGDEAEELVLEYMKKMNRPFGAADISANMGQVLSKALTQKALVALAEKGKLVKKDYGKQTIFVFPQASLPPVSNDELAKLTADLETVTAQVGQEKKVLKGCLNEVERLKGEPLTVDLEGQLSLLLASIKKKETKLEGMKGGAVLVAPEELNTVETEWTVERTQWVKRKKVYLSAVDGIMGEASAAQRDQWEEDLGIEKSSEEAVRLEASLVGPSSTTHPPTAAQAGRKGLGAGVSESAGGGGEGTGVKRKGSKAGGGGGKAKKTKTKV